MYGNDLTYLIDLYVDMTGLIGMTEIKGYNNNYMRHMMRYVLLLVMCDHIEDGCIH